MNVRGGCMSVQRRDTYRPDVDEHASTVQFDVVLLQLMEVASETDALVQMKDVLDDLDVGVNVELFFLVLLTQFSEVEDRIHVIAVDRRRAVERIQGDRTRTFHRA